MGFLSFLFGSKSDSSATTPSGKKDELAHLRKALGDVRAQPTLVVVAAAIRDTIGLDPSVPVEADMLLMGDLGADVLSCAEIIIAVEDLYGVAISEVDLPEANYPNMTVGDVVAATDRAL